MKRCTVCGKTYKWESLPFVGRTTDLEMRNCPCGSTLACPLLTVTAGDIERGLPESEDSCPIALAAQRAGFERVVIGEGRIFWDGGSQVLPDAARFFIRSFDDRDHVEPFSFVVVC